MRRHLKLLTLCFVMLALPFKGMAAANVAFCDPLHEQETATHGHHHDGVSAEHHHHHGDHSADSNLHDPDNKTDAAGTAKCIACAACAAHAVAGTPAIVAPDLISDSSLAIPFLSSMHAGIFAYGLERPPKTLLS